MGTFTLTTGYVAPEDLQLCSLRAVVTYPDRFIGEANRDRVSSCPSAFFISEFTQRLIIFETGVCGLL